MLRNDGQRVKDIENDIPGTSGDLDPRTFRNDKGLGVCTSDWDDKNTMADTEKMTYAKPPEVEKGSTSQDRRRSLPSKVAKHANDADEAMKAFAGHEGEFLELDEATSKRLLKRIDLHLMPLLCVIYGLNYLDKTTLSYASVMNIKKDINLIGDDYQWLGSMFYFGQSKSTSSAANSKTGFHVKRGGKEDGN
ncbi:MAG: hypothetical protein LQ343_004661 [Gyalolechia ehrenbergii]|nr:MAG: hypothetical protein LQ343_004661 [Gyalolechia ehrenbergii]